MHLDFNDNSSQVRLIKKAREFPVYECLISEGWQENGFPRIVLSRKQTDNRLIVGAFLVDTYCLGIKNAFCKADISIEEYENLKLRMFQMAPAVTCYPRLANRIIYGAVEYARKLRFEPHEDCLLSSFVLEEPSHEDLSFDVEFGKDGKPLYIAGPDDNVDDIMEKLTNRLGEENFHYIIASD